MKFARSLIFAMVLQIACNLGADESNSPSDPVRLIPVRNASVHDSFWSPKIQIYREKTIPHSWFYMQWELRALRKAAGQPVDGELNGTWGEANLHKFLHTAANSLAIAADPALEKKVEEVIDLLAAAQQPDGYLHAFVTNNKKQPWDPGFLDGSHDGYVLGHMIEAAIAYQEATGKDRFLQIARRAADQAYQHFLGAGGKPGFCGHAELEMALVSLFQATKDPKYLELSKAFVEWRGHGKVKAFSETPRAYFQDQFPVREQRTLEGHAVRAVFFASGVAGLAIETGNSDYRLAANRFWDSTTARRMAITGSIGPRQEHEAFGEDYELPANGYYESCAACGLADFAQRMFQLERTSDAADVLERVLYNAILHGISLDGTNTYYQNPLSDHDHMRDNCWVCCPPNLSRTLLQIGRYACAYAGNELYVNLFVGGSYKVSLAPGPVALAMETEYPWKGDVLCRMKLEKPMRFALMLRKPAWCAKAGIKVNGAAVATDPLMRQGYIRLEREWANGDVIEMAMDMPVQRMTAHPNMKDFQGKVALQRGPIVYGFEGVDNKDNPRIVLGAEVQFQVEHCPNLLGGVTVIRGKASDDQPFLAIPFYALANRGKSSQDVWVSQQQLKTDNSWWMGLLYRPMR